MRINDNGEKGQMAKSADVLLANAMAERPLSLHLLAASFFGLATTAAIVSQQSNRPITAAIVFLFGVTMVGAFEGLWGGLIAAVVASVIYNFFLSDPVFRFSLTSAEEYVPLIAFNVSAAASALLVGRLKDRALAAESANRRMRALFAVSERLQAAVNVTDIPAAIDEFGSFDSATAQEIYLNREGELQPLQNCADGQILAEHLWVSGTTSLTTTDRQAYLLSTPARRTGVLVIAHLPRAHSQSQAHYLEAFVNLLSITVERCLLLESLSQAELVRRSEEFKSALLSSVSHDMRTPLSAISASASSLSRFGPSLGEDTRADLLEMIQEQCEKLNRYTSNLLNLGRIQAGFDPSQFRECDALEVLGTAIAHARQLGPEHEIVKDYDAEQALVRGDPVMLEQAFYNILENAVRYSPSRSRIVVAAELKGDRLVISVADEGEGIAEADLGKVFERFYRARSSAAHDGSGLGLSIAKGFVEAFGGTVEASRADPVRGGTVVRVTLLREREAAVNA